MPKKVEIQLEKYQESKGPIKGAVTFGKEQYQVESELIIMTYREKGETGVNTMIAGSTDPNVMFDYLVSVYENSAEVAKRVMAPREYPLFIKDFVRHIRKSAYEEGIII